jgi:antitoxin HicB
VSKTAIKMQPKPLEYYLSLDYPVTVYPDSEGGFVAEIKELPGCMTQAETIEELMDNINEARELWIETVYESGKRDIPLPVTEQDYSGKFVLRVPKYLHRRLAEQAEREGISLNQYAVSLLSAASA